MKILDVKQEVKFILEAPPLEVYHYIKENTLCSKSEKALVERGLTETLIFYIKKQGIKEPAQTEIFRQNNKDVIRALFTHTRNADVTMKLMLLYGHYSTAIKYIRQTRTPLYKERKVIWYGTNAEIAAIINKDLSVFARYDIIMSGLHSVIPQLIKTCPLAEREQYALATLGTPYEIDLLIEHHKENADALYQIKAIRFGSYAEQLEAIKKGHFKKMSEHFFFEQGPFELIERYLDFYGFLQSQAQCILLKRNDKVDILPYLETHDLYIEAEELLMKRRNYAEIGAYIKYRALSPDGQMALLDIGKTELILQYITKRRFKEAAETELVLRNDDKELLEYVTRYELSTPALKALFKVNNLTVINEYVSRHRLPEAFEVKLFCYGKQISILNYVNAFVPSLKGQTELLSTGNIEAAFACLRHWMQTDLSLMIHDDIEILMLEQGTHVDVMAYLSLHSLTANGQLALLARNDVDEIIELINRYPLTEAAGEDLVLYGPIEAIDVWMKLPTP